MEEITLYCTQLRKEEKNLIIEAERQHLPIKYSMLKNGVAFPQKAALSIIRTLGHAESLSLASMLELSGSKTLNSSAAIRYCTDKSLAAFLMNAHGVPQPNFEIAFSPEHIFSISQQFKFPFVIKPLSSSWGRGICLVRDQFCLENWAAGRESVDVNYKHFPVMIQEYIDKPGYDLRVVVVGEKPIVAFKRVSEHWITNTHLGAKVETMELNEEMENVVELVMKAIGTGFFGIDLFVTRNGKYLFNEINHNPDFAYSSSIHKVDVAKHYIGYVKDLYDKLN